MSECEETSLCLLSVSFFPHPFAIVIMIIENFQWWMLSNGIIYGFAHHMLCHFKSEYNILMLSI